MDADRDYFFLGSLVGVGVSSVIGIILYFNNTDLSKIIPYASILATFMAVTMGLLIYKRNMQWRIQDSRIESSKFYLEKSLETYSYFYELLKNKNNDRYIWIMASRILADADELSLQVLHKPHQVFFEVKKMEVRNNLFDVLTYIDPKTGVLAPLPTAFFFGVDNWEEKLAIDAAKESTGKIKASAVKLYENRSSSKMSYLSMKSIIPILNFLDYPVNYEDPLQQYTSNDASEWSNMFGYKTGGKNYIEFRLNNGLSNGEVHPKKSR